MGLVGMANRIRLDKEANAVSTSKPDPSSPVSVADIDYAFNFLKQSTPSHVEARADRALSEIELALKTTQKTAKGRFGEKLDQLLGSPSSPEKL